MDLCLNIGDRERWGEPIKLHLIPKVTCLKIAFLSESGHKNLKFEICGVDFPPPGPHFKTCAKIAIFMTWSFDAVFCFSRIDDPPRVRNERVSAEFAYFSKF